MATRFYLPSSGTAPLGSLAVDSQWELADNLERRPCDVIKSNTSLTQKSANWTSTTTQQWCWVQFQSKRMSTGYSWTTSDTVSMVIKVAEAAAQVDSHLCYVVRVVSGDGATIRGTVGAYLTTSTEYPTSLGGIATRIHNARTNGASSFTSYAGDRIIIEIGHHGVSPTINTVYHNYGDPSGTSDYALTADLTTDLCPWVELSRDVSFVLSDSQASYTKGRSNGLDSQAGYVAGGLDTSDSQSAYTNGSPEAQQVSDNQGAYTHGRTDTTPDSINAYVRGQTDVIPDSQGAYTKGAVGINDSKDAFTHGQTDATPDSIDAYTKGQIDVIPDSQVAYTKGAVGINDSQNGFTKGSSTALDNINAFVQGSFYGLSHTDGYTKGNANIIDNIFAYTFGSISVNNSQAAYTEGYTTGGPANDSHSAFVIGLDNGLIPDSDKEVQTVGDWKNELDATTNLYQSIDEYPIANDNDYIYHINPTTDEYYECSLSNPTGNIGSGDVVVFWRGRDKSGSGTAQATVQLRQGETIVASTQQILTALQTTYYFTLSPAEKASITDWNNLRIRIIITIL